MAEAGPDRAGPEEEAEFGFASRGEPRWPASIAVFVAIALQVILPERIVLGPRPLLPSLEGALALALLLTSPMRRGREPKVLRGVSIALIALINAANLVSLGYLVNDLLFPHSASISGRVLVYSSVPVWLTNIIVFALWYWELDRGGPGVRATEHRRAPDFLFPQMTAPGVTNGPWSPSFHDYLYVSFTNVTAFSPTDTMPLTGWAKLLMMIQSLASLLTVALVVSRAVNILAG
jgi:uncharacterized membrane protein